MKMTILSQHGTEGAAEKLRDKARRLWAGWTWIASKVESRSSKMIGASTETFYPSASQSSAKTSRIAAKICISTFYSLGDPFVSANSGIHEYPYNGLMQFASKSISSCSS